MKAYFIPIFYFCDKRVFIESLFIPWLFQKEWGNPMVSQFERKIKIIFDHELDSEFFADGWFIFAKDRIYVARKMNGWEGIRKMFFDPCERSGSRVFFVACCYGDEFVFAQSQLCQRIDTSLQREYVFVIVELQIERPKISYDFLFIKTWLYVRNFPPIMVCEVLEYRMTPWLLIYKLKNRSVACCNSFVYINTNFLADHSCVRLFYFQFPLRILKNLLHEIFFQWFF